MNAVIFKALHLRGSGDPATAVDLLLAAVSHDPNCAVLLHHLSLAWQDVGNAPNAIAAAQKSVALKPSAIPRHRLAVLLLNEGRYEESLAELNAILNSNHDVAPALFEKAKIMETRGHREIAVELLTKAIGFSPCFVDAYLKLAETYTKHSSHKDAELTLRRLTKFCPRFLAGHVELANCLGLQKLQTEEMVAWQEAAAFIQNSSEGERRVQGAESQAAFVQAQLKRLHQRGGG